MVQIELSDEAFGHLSHLPGVVVESDGAELHDVVQRQAAM